MDSLESEPTPKDSYPLGEHLSMIIEAGLGDRIEFPDPAGLLMGLQESMGDLDKVVIHEDNLKQELEERRSAVINEVAQARISRHEQMLRVGKVMTEDLSANHENRWKKIDKTQIPAFQENIDAAKERLRNGPGNIEMPFTANAAETSIALATHQISELARQIYEILPGPQPRIEPTAHQKLALTVLRREIGDYIPYPQEEAHLDDATRRRLARKIRALTSALDQIKNDPVSFLANIVTDNDYDELATAAMQTVDDAISASNSKLITVEVPPNTKKIRPRRIAKTAPASGPKAPKAIDLTTNSGEDHEIDLNRNEANEITVADMAPMKVNLPWLDDGGEELPIQKFSVNDRYALIINSISQDRRLQDVSAASRSKFSTRKGGQNAFDAITQTLAQRVAQGIMPYQDKTVRRMFNRDAATYGDTTIWYSYDIGPNTPRVYFTVKSLGEICESEAVSKNNLGNDDQCLIVIAETDKANQLKTLQVLTGKSRRYLRTTGVGSI